ncbi:MAG: signal peptidase I [Roseburia faecis]|nr:signal peptidase I [Roseburia faecis]
MCKQQGVVEEIKKGNKKKRAIHHDTIVFLIVIFFLAFFASHPVSGMSMYPTYHNGQRTYGMRFYPFSLHTGDVVTAYANGKLLIKRVAAGPGDTFTITTDGKAYVNGQEYAYGAGRMNTENTFAGMMNTENTFAGMTKDTDGNYTITLKKNEYYLIGDNHENSLDSRYVGPVSRIQILEKTFLVK